MPTGRKHDSTAEVRSFFYFPDNFKGAKLKSKQGLYEKKNYERLSLFVTFFGKMYTNNNLLAIRKLTDS